MQTIHRLSPAGSKGLWLKGDNSIMRLTAMRSMHFSARSFILNLFTTFHNFIQAFESDIFSFLEATCGGKSQPSYIHIMDRDAHHSIEFLCLAGQVRRHLQPNLILQ